MLITWSWVNVFTILQIYASRSSNVWNNRLEKSLLNFAQIFSAGFNSGLYGGRNIRIIFSGIINAFALWKAPLSSTITFSSVGLCKENSLRNNWKVCALQCGISKRKWSPVIGENAPKRYKDWKTCWNGHIGFTPNAAKAFPFLVNKPNLLSSWK